MSATSWLQKARRIPASPGAPEDDLFQGTRKPSDRSSPQRSRSRDSASYQSTPASPTPHTSTWDRFKKKAGLGSPKHSNRSLEGGLTSGGSRSSFLMVDQPSKLRGRNPNPEMFSPDSPPAVPPKTGPVSAVQIVASRLSMSPNSVMEQHNRKGGLVDGGTVITTTALLKQVDSAIDTSVIPCPQPVPNSNSTADDSWWQQVKGHMNYLGQELHKKQQELSQRDHEIATLQGEAEKSKAELARLGEELNAARKVLPPEAAAYEEQLAAQNALIERLRAKAADSAGIAAEVPLGQSRLQVTEPRIVEAWRELAFEIHNFALCYLSIQDLGTRKMEQWAKVRGDKLKEICPAYAQMALDKAASSWFIEAAIWQVLHGAIFASSTTHGNACWAGIYQNKLEKLSWALVSSIKPSEPDKTRHFHQWKAATTSLIYTLGPTATNVNEAIFDVADKLEELIDPFKSRLPMAPVRDNLQKIVAKAVAFDEMLCGQQSWYYLCYPEPRDNFYLDRESTDIAEGASTTGQKARFVIRPSLSRTGGRRGEGSYAERHVVDKWLVWA
ncbi:hypothetical protein QBC40DRAFT_169977 [Triangularia verruculosa]|uniref:Uncharacterized protein n=1 Tax=Triangularia verruculosa TaxID=2587418 RepID=A0AAN6XPB5_9PEZI|nr:hypothetical protein QBC40DRAFT_169977 [Triangularia verruculosa]